MRHSKARPQICTKYSTPQGCSWGKKCRFLHPQAPSKHPNSCPPAPAAANSKIVRVTGFARTTNIDATERMLQSHLAESCKLDVKVTVTTPATSPPFALVFCNNPAAATAAVQHFQASSHIAGLGNLQAQFHNCAALQQPAVQTNGNRVGTAFNGGQPAAADRPSRAAITGAQPNGTHTHQRPPRVDGACQQVCLKALYSVTSTLQMLLVHNCC